MNLLSGAFKYVAGIDETTPDSSAGKVERYIDRIVGSSLPQDRRAAVKELGELVKRDVACQEKVAKLGMKVFIAILQQDRPYQDTVVATLELLIQLVTQPDIQRVAEEHLLDQSGAMDIAQNIALENAKLFVKHQDAVAQVLELLEEEDFAIRFNVIELLTALLSNDAQLVQQNVLEASQGVTRLLDLLRDHREVIRNETILLLTALSKNCEEIQKILAFENIFERLFDTITSSLSELDISCDTVVESRGIKVQSDGNDEKSHTLTSSNVETEILIHDCLLLLCNLLQDNGSNQKYFRETGCIPRLNTLLTLSDTDVSSISPQRAEILRYTLEAILSLVDSNQNSMDIQQNKTVCATSGVLKAVIYIALSPFPDQLSIVCVRAFQAWKLLLKNHRENRLYSGGISVLDPQNRSPIGCIVAAFDICCTDSSPTVRLAAFELIELFLIDDASDSNSFLKVTFESEESFFSWLNDSKAIIKTREELEKELENCSSYEKNMSTLSFNILDTVVGWPDEADAVGVFYACRLLSNLLCKLENGRISLLKARTAFTKDYFFMTCMRSLSRAERNSAPGIVKIGLLILIATWLYSCSEAVEYLLSSAMHIPLLVELATRHSPNRDEEEVHIQGLAALVLAICLEEEEKTRPTLIAVIRQRMGITSFAAKLDEIRASEAFVLTYTDILLLKPESVINSTTLVDPKLGHQCWYDSSFVHIFNDVYSKLQKYIWELVSITTDDETRATQTTSYERAADNHSFEETKRRTVSSESSKSLSRVIEETEVAEMTEATEAYKAIIRKQDLEIERQRQRLDELQKIVDELQKELDAQPKMAVASMKKDLDEKNSSLESLNGQLQDSLKRIEQLESQLTEKETDLKAISRACSELETENEKVMRFLGFLFFNTNIIKKLREHTKKHVSDYKIEASGPHAFASQTVQNEEAQTKVINEASDRGEAFGNEGLLEQEQAPKDNTVCSNTSSYSSLVDENKQLRSRIEELVGSIEEWRSYCEQVKEESELSQRNADEFRVMTEQMEVYANRLSTSEQYQQKLEEENQVLRTKYCDLQSQLEYKTWQLDELLRQKSSEANTVSEVDKNETDIRTRRGSSEQLLQGIFKGVIREIKELLKEEEENWKKLEYTDWPSEVSSTNFTETAAATEGAWSVEDLQEEYQEALEYIEELQQRNSSLVHIISQYMLRFQEQYNILENEAFVRIQLQIDLLENFSRKLNIITKKTVDGHL
eukprot:jgi/Galph1/711/GphlegSOOS_G5485.1